MQQEWLQDTHRQPAYTNNWGTHVVMKLRTVQQQPEAHQVHRHGHSKSCLREPAAKQVTAVIPCTWYMLMLDAVLCCARHLVLSCFCTVPSHLNACSVLAVS